MNDEFWAGKDLGDDILREQVRLAMSQLPTMQATSFIVALVLCYAIRTMAPPWRIIEWITLNCWAWRMRIPLLQMW